MDAPSLNADFLSGESDMAARMRAFDWESHPLGPPHSWPQSLKVAVRILLTSRFAMWMGWGPDYTFFCNDAYLPTLGNKHTWALGASTKQVWAEIWPVVGPRADKVVRTGAATWDEALRLFLERSGYAEETYHTFSYSPLPDDAGRIGGMLCVVTEDTERVISERRLALLGTTAASLAAATTERDLLKAFNDEIVSRPHDVPFALLYLADSAAQTARLACSPGTEAGSPIAPVTFDLHAAEAPWPLAAANASGRIVTVDALESRFASLPTGVWEQPSRQAMIIPLACQGQERIAGWMVAAINPFRPLDDSYRRFLSLLAGQFEAALSNVRAYETERDRARALAELDAAKTTFFSNVSHEFRTPLTLMLGPLEDVAALPQEAVSPEVREKLGLAHRNSLRLLKLVNTLLDFSRIEAGRMGATFEPLDLAAFTGELAGIFRSAIERAGIKLIVDCPRLPQPVYADRDMWEKIVFNLLSNALKHTFHGSITVSLRVVENAPLLTVADTGAGIPSDALPKLFDRFFRVQGAQARTHEGSGIGLSLVRELVTLHSGSIRVQSTPGKGSEFFVSLPFGRDHLPADRVGKPSDAPHAHSSARAFLTEASRWVDSGSHAEVDVDVARETFEAAPATVAAAADASRVLLVDDNTDMREYVARLLAPEYQVESVGNGLQALQAARRSRPDLILSDIMMPELDGFGLLRELRADPELREVPVILLSARAGEEAKLDGLDAGADDYLIKPFSARELMARVSSQLKMSRLRTESFRREYALRTEAETINDVARGLTAELDLPTLLQKLTDAGAVLTGASSGAFFFFDERTRTFSPTPSATVGRHDGPMSNLEWAAAAPLLRDISTARSEAQAGASIPSGQANESSPLPWRSTLVAPVATRTGELLGALIFVHSEPEKFADRTRRLAAGVAAQAAIAIDNARLYSSITSELARRTAAESALRESEQRYSRLVDRLPAAIYTCDVQGRITLFNEAAIELWGRTPSVGQDRWCGSLRMFRPDGTPVPLDECPMAMAIKTGRGDLRTEIIVERPDGTRRHVILHPDPIRDDSGRITGAVNMLIDITRAKHAEQALQDAYVHLEERVRERTRQLAEVSAKYQAMYDQGLFAGFLSTDGAVIDANRSCLNHCGFTREEVVGKPFWETGWWNRSPAVQSWIKNGFDQAMQGVRFHGETMYFLSDGSERFVDFAYVPLKDDRGEITSILATGLDITDRKTAERERKHADALRDSEARFREMADNAPVMVWVTDPLGSCNYLSKSWYTFTGQTPETGLGMGRTNVIHSDDRELSRDTFAAANAQQVPFRLEYRIRRVDGQYRWAIDAATPRFDHDGRYLGYVGSVTDITDQVQARHTLERQQMLLEEAVKARTSELLASNERLQLAERMASLGTLSAGLGHDMSNLLVPIRVRLDSLSQAALSKDLKEDVEAIRTSAEYLQRLSNGLRMLAIDPSRGMPLETTELAAWWTDAAPLMKNALPRNVTLEASFPDPQLRIAMARSGITQVVFNLVQNAGDAMRSRGRGKVSIRAEQMGEQVHIVVADDGPGMSPDVKTRCMEPFFTTKTRGISTGLGLVLVFGLIRDAGGSVELQSETDRGTTFLLKLPIGRLEQKPAGAGQGKIAVVDIKDARIRAFVTAELRSLAFEIRPRETPETADEGRGADVLILDDSARIPDNPSTRIIRLADDSSQTGGSESAVINVGSRPKRQDLREAFARITQNEVP